MAPIPWLSALKGFVQAKFDTDAHFSVDPKINVAADGDRNKQKVVFKNRGNVNIFNFPKETSGEDIKQIKKLIDPAFENDDVAFILSESKTLLEGYKDFEESGETHELKSFFKDKISDTDFRLLETGLYIRFLIDNEQSTSKIKNDVIRQYGPRGKNIVNLASADYYSTHIKPLYEALSEQEGFEETDFKQEYEKIIVELPFAIFVNGGQSGKDILKDINDKAARNIKYGVSENIIVLHGYGSNAETIESILLELNKTYQRIAPSTQYIGHLKVITVDIYYKEHL
jgi:hypothetical protein